MSPSNAKNKSPVVQYGLTSGNYTSTAVGTSDSYSFLLYSSGLMNHVVIGPLQDSTTYYYKCGGTGDEFKFKTPPPVGPDVPISFAVAGKYFLSRLTILQFNTIFFGEGDKYAFS